MRAERDEIGKFKMGANISIQFIRSFVTVVNSGGFIRASEELGLSSPTVSLQVKRLEELLGTPLFEKSSRLVLTKAGQSCFECGLKLLAIYDEMLERNAEITQKVPSGDLVSGHE